MCCHGAARIVLTAPRSYEAVALHRGACEKRLRDGKLATSSIGDAPSLLGRRDGLEQGSMVPFFDPHNIMEVVIVQPWDRGSVRTQAVFGDDPLAVGVVLAQFRDEAFGGMALTIVFLGAVLLDNRLGHQRHDCALIGVNERGAQHLVPIGDGAMAVMRCQTRVTVHLVGGNIARTIEGSEVVAFHKHHLFKRFAALEGAKDVLE